MSTTRPQPNCTSKQCHDKIFLGAVLLGIVLMALHVIFNNYIDDDTAKYYAPMARAFAEGNYERAFYDMIPPLMPVIGGIVAKVLPLDAFSCLILISGLFFVASLYPLRRFLLNFVSPQLASWGCVAYICVPRLIDYAGAGLLTTGKLFFLIWAIVLIIDYAKEHKVSKLVWLGANLAGLSLIRGEGVIYIPFLFIWAVILLKKSIDPADKHRFRKFFIQTSRAAIIVGGVLLLCLSPRMYQMQREFGAPVLDSRQAGRFKETVRAVKRILGDDVKTTTDLSTVDKVETHTNIPPNVNADIDDSPLTPHNLRETLKRFLNGSYQIYLVFSIIGIILVICKKRWSSLHTFAITLIIFNAIIFIPIAIASRYYTINIIMFLPFTLVAVQSIYARCNSRNTLLLFRGVISLVLLVQVVKGSKHIRKKKYLFNEYKQVGEWINAHRSDFVKDTPVILPKNMMYQNYQPGTDLIIASRKVQTAYWAKADHIGLNDLVFDEQNFLKYIQGNKVDLIVAEANLLEYCSKGDYDAIITSSSAKSTIFKPASQQQK